MMFNNHGFFKDSKSEKPLIVDSVVEAFLIGVINEFFQKPTALGPFEHFIPFYEKFILQPIFPTLKEPELLYRSLNDNLIGRNLFQQLLSLLHQLIVDEMNRNPQLHRALILEHNYLPALTSLRDPNFALKNVAYIGILANLLTVPIKVYVTEPLKIVPAIMTYNVNSKTPILINYCNGSYQIKVNFLEKFKVYLAKDQSLKILSSKFNDPSLKQLIEKINADNLRISQQVKQIKNTLEIMLKSKEISMEKLFEYYFNQKNFPSCYSGLEHGSENLINTILTKNSFSQPTLNKDWLQQQLMQHVAERFALSSSPDLQEFYDAISTERKFNHGVR